MQQTVAMETVVSEAAVQSHNGVTEEKPAHSEIMPAQRSTSTPTPTRANTGLSLWMQLCCGHAIARLLSERRWKSTGSQVLPE